MNIVKLLDHYRVTLADDRESTLTLACLAKEGAQPETAIFKLINLPVQQARAKLGQLYRANYVRLVGGDRWNITELGGRLLAGLGVLEAVHQHQISEQPFENAHRAFLSSCVSSERDDGLGDETRTSLLKSAVYLAKHYKTVATGSESLQRVFYALLVGLDQRAAGLGPANFCNSMRSYIHGHETNLDDSPDLWKNVLVSCKRAFRDARSSNAAILEGKVALREANEVTKLVTWSRVLNTVASGRPDSVLAQVWRANPGRAELFFNDMSSVDPSFVEVSWKFLDDEGLVEESERACEPAEALRLSLLRAIRRSVPAGAAERRDLWMELQEGGLGHSDVEAIKIATSLTQLRLRILGGQFENLSEKPGLAMISSVKDLASAAENWWALRDSKSHVGAGDGPSGDVGPEV